MGICIRLVTKTLYVIGENRFTCGIYDDQRKYRALRNKTNIKAKEEK